MNVMVPTILFGFGGALVSSLAYVRLPKPKKQ
jgi:hypothetical protein